MALNSFTFLFLFLPGFLLFFFCTPKRGRSSLLLLASFFFYYWIEGKHALVLILPALLLLLVGPVIENAGKRFSRFVFVGSLSLLLLVLFYFKYTGFIVANVNAVRMWLGMSPIWVRSIHLPLGISFYIFSALSYLIDVRRGRAPRQRGMLSPALYLSFFPKLLNGPIIPYHQFCRNAPDRGSEAGSLAYGIRRFVLGLGKKLLIADNLARGSGFIFSVPLDQLDVRLAWTGVLAFSLQIYFDFSGYSDMAIGLARIVGIDLPENFRYPYVSRSVKEFWSRWHITLSQWYRDYLFLPVAFALSRRLKKESYLSVDSEHWCYVGATLSTMILCGFWHGAGWTFVLWGAYYGIMLVLEHVWLGRYLRRIWRPLSHLYFLIAVGLGWVLFRASTLHQAWYYYKAMFGFGHSGGSVYSPAMFLDSENELLLIAGIIGSIPFSSWLGSHIRSFSQNHDQNSRRWFGRVLATCEAAYVILIALLSTLSLAGAGYHPFLYSKF